MRKVEGLCCPSKECAGRTCARNGVAERYTELVQLLPDVSARVVLLVHELWVLVQVTPRSNHEAGKVWAACLPEQLSQRRVLLMAMAAVAGGHGDAQ